MFSQLKPEFYPDRNQVIDFIPPQRHDGKNSYIWFSQIDPMTGRLKRKKYMLDRFKPGKERDFASNRIIANIYNKVLHGWNVWAPTNTNRSDTAITDVIERYRTYITNIQNKES